MKSRRPSPELVLKWIDAGHGQGTGAEYQPFLRVRDVPSQGASSQVFSRITNRVHHYLSELEHSAHLLAEYEPDTTDIREQFALLPWKETQQIANELNISHPRYRSTSTPTVMTTDLLITHTTAEGEKLTALCIKPEGNLNDRRTLEKLHIEQTFWTRRGVSWRLVTDSALRRIRVRNLRFFEPGVYRSLDPRIERAASLKFEECWRPGLRYIEILRRCLAEAATTFSPDEFHQALSQSVWSRTSRIEIDTHPIDHNSRIQLREASGTACTR